jgi:hypothetical protein
MRSTRLERRRTAPGIRRAWFAAAMVTVAVGLAACGGGSGGDGAGSTTPGPRPSSPAKVTIETPTNGESFKAGVTIPVEVQLTGARIVRRTTTHITPTTGHLHLYLDNSLVSMNYKTTNELKGVKPGMHVMKIEFVASDHNPFDPRVITAVTFEVTK